ncbi:putative rnapii degradation factor def1 [Golovinomyces cichoracearum]|uniref:RNA polymerase II degradation factor 1 n=1 Tax=Golovinomyces cichoracearum TaxID=62708 RepID=A0A420HWA6_9PEZI|nr:putative rnapii degradation factor def1 [Golovinomyces cichoracearum]
MSEVQTRPFAPRGRGSVRGVRSGFSSGGRGGRAHGYNGNKPETAQAKVEEVEEDEVAQLKKLYSSQVAMIREMFPNWSEENIIFALQETAGDLELTVERITDGTLSQWGEVSNAKKDRSKSKIKETSMTSSGESTNRTRASRGGRAGFESGRGSRSHGADRGRGGKSRGSSNTNIPTTRKVNTGNSIPTDEWAARKNSSSVDRPPSHNKNTDDSLTTPKSTDDSTVKSVAKVATASTEVPPTILPDGVQKKSWATLFASAPLPKKSTAPHAERPSELSKVEEPDKPLPNNPSEQIPNTAIDEPAVVTNVEFNSAEKTEVTDRIPSRDDLTEDNLEQLPEVLAPVQTATAASTAASTWDTRDGTNSSPPYIASQNDHQQGIHSATNFQTPAAKVNSTSGRTPSYQRRVFDQEEAVRMPGNREVDRAAVQFGAFYLKDDNEDDVDGDREEAETRAQPPLHSPVAPRASLPPVNRQTTPVADSLSTPKPSTGLPVASIPSAVPTLPSPAPPSSAPVVVQQGPQTNGQFGQYGRFAQGGTPDKPYENFSQQTPSVQSSFEGYPPQQSQTLANATNSGAFSSTPNDFSSYYATDPQQRNVYNSFYQPPYGSQHQGAQATQAQDGSTSHQRSYNGYNATQGENSSQFPQSASHQPQSRFIAASESQNSGHTTPNPVSQAPHPGAATQSGQPQASQQQPQVPGTYQYGHPYYSSPYYSTYVNHYPGYGNGNFPAGPYAAKTGIHQFQGYNIHGPPFEHSGSHGTAAFGVSSLHGRDSALGVLSEYGRTGSAQSTQASQNIGGSSTFGTGHDAFGRGSSYQGQGQPQYGNQQSSQQNGDDMKPFNDSKSGNGPNSSLQGGRPASATNTSSGASALPQPLSQQVGYGSYPVHLQQPGHNLHGNHSTSQYGALGGSSLQHQASGQGHQNSQYGGYQGSGGGNYYNNSQQRGGWGGNYGH